MTINEEFDFSLLFDSLEQARWVWRDVFSATGSECSIVEGHVFGRAHLLAVPIALDELDSRLAVQPFSAGAGFIGIVLQGQT